MSVVDEQLSVGLRWLADGRRVVCALLIDAEGSSPFEPGAFMLIDAEGAIEGSITGGCVESDVVENALEILAGDGPPRLLRYGVSDELAHTVGLMCGGTVEVLAHELRGDARDGLRRGVRRGGARRRRRHRDARRRPRGGRQAGRRRGARGRRASAARSCSTTRSHATSLALSERRTSALRHYGDAGEALGGSRTVHLHAFGVPPTLVLVGAIDYSAAVAALASQVGYRVVIVDAREAFARSDRFSRVATVHVGLAAKRRSSERALGPRDAVIVFSHDPKFDEPAILAALRSDVGFIGALGSRRTAADRNRAARRGRRRSRSRSRACTRPAVSTSARRLPRRSRSRSWPR